MLFFSAAETFTKFPRDFGSLKAKNGSKKNLTCMPCEDRMLGLILHDRKLSVRVKKTGNRKLIAFMGILKLPIFGVLRKYNFSLPT